MEEGEMAHFNILPLILEQLKTAHELRLVMFDIIKFLAPAHKVMAQLLSPHTKSDVHRKDLETNLQPEEYNIPKKDE